MKNRLRCLWRRRGEIKPTWRTYLLTAFALVSLVYAGRFLADLKAADGVQSNSAARLDAAKRVLATRTADITVSDVVTKALVFEAMLTSTQQATLQLTYTATLARKWSNLPCTNTCRNGIGLGTLTSDQLAAALAVIQAVQGTATNEGFDQFEQIRMADDVLAASAGGGYGSGNYYLAFLNTPSATGAWMMQFGGHHYAANISFNGGHIVSATPYFFGLEPTSFTVSGTTYTPLQQEHDVMTAMLSSFSATQLTTAKLSQTFSDAVMIPGATEGGTDTFPTPKVGIAVSSLNDAQQQLVLAAMQPWLQNMDATVAANLLAIYQSELAGTYVAWTGNGTSGNASSFLNANTNYVRIDGPSIWIEFICQNGVVFQNQIHYHTVWRDHTRDYAQDLSLTTAIDTSTATSNCSYSISPAGEAFSASGGTGTISVTATTGCDWSVSGAPSWMVFAGASTGTGNGSLSYTISPNSDAYRSASLTIGGQTYTVEQDTASITGSALAGSLAQIASAGTWSTSFTYINTGTSAGQVQTSFFADDGTALRLPLTFPQLSGTGSVLASTLDRTINSEASLLISSTGPDAQAAAIGWGQVVTTGTINGFAIFSNPTYKWNAAVPLETRNASSYLLAFDNTGVLTTGVAIANLASQAASVNIVIRDDTGAQVGTGVINLASLGHASFMLDANYPVTINKRGTVECDTPSGGQISVLGLRANGAALTTLPVLANVDSSGGSITHSTFNGGFTSLFTLVNTATTSSDATLNFYDDTGAPLSSSLFLPQTSETLVGTSITRTLAPGASLLVQAKGDDSLPTVQGSAVLTTTGAVGGFAIFDWTTYGQEASVPLETRNASGYVLAFDNTGVLTTGLALANVAAASATVPVIIRDDTGTVLQTTTIALAAQGHTSFMLPAQYTVTAGKRGTIEFDTPTSGRISALGLRAESDGTLTALPVFAK